MAASDALDADPLTAGLVSDATCWTSPIRVRGDYPFDFDASSDDCVPQMAARRLIAIRESGAWSRQNLAYQLGIDVADLIRYELGLDEIPDELVDRLTGVFDVDSRHFTGELSKGAVEQVLGKAYFEAPASLSPEARQSVRDFIAFMVEIDKRRR